MVFTTTRSRSVDWGLAAHASMTGGLLAALLAAGPFTATSCDSYQFAIRGRRALVF